jgi:hypothetical protein
MSPDSFWQTILMKIPAYEDLPLREREEFILNRREESAGPSGRDGAVSRFFPVLYQKLPVCSPDFSPSVVNINTVILMHDAYMNVTPVLGVGSGIIIDPEGIS